MQEGSTPSAVDLSIRNGKVKPNPFQVTKMGVPRSFVKALSLCQKACRRSFSSSIVRAMATVSFGAEPFITSALPIPMMCPNSGVSAIFFLRRQLSATESAASLARY
jgi:hypothetical protein